MFRYLLVLVHCSPVEEIVLDVLLRCEGSWIGSAPPFTDIRSSLVLQTAGLAVMPSAGRLCSNLRSTRVQRSVLRRRSSAATPRTWTSGLESAMQRSEMKVGQHCNQGLAISLLAAHKLGSNLCHSCLGDGDTVSMNGRVSVEEESANDHELVCNMNFACFADGDTVSMNGHVSVEEAAPEAPAVESARNAPAASSHQPPPPDSQAAPEKVCFSTCVLSSLVLWDAASRAEHLR